MAATAAATEVRPRNEKRKPEPERNETHSSGIAAAPDRSEASGRGQVDGWVGGKTNLLSSSGLCNGQRNTQDGVGTQLALVWSAIEAVQERVDSSLVLDIEVLLDHGRRNDLVDVVDSLEHTLSTPLGLVAIAELNSLVLAYSSSDSTSLSRVCV